ncbi:MAG: helix-turn-helix domain-containing protein [Clostridia bacterium]|nr:helix-turn-helix domain-containing protein [Clostridia bacterium]
MKLLAHYISAIAKTHPEIINWRENYLNDSLFYSCRATHYDRNTYPSSLHYHDYYELVILEEGDIHYISEGSTFKPQKGDLIVIPPRRLHMSAIDADETLYKRHVFYLYPDALSALGCDALTDFLISVNEARCQLSLPGAEKASLLSLLSRLDHALAPDADKKDRALSLGLVIEIFYLLSLAQADTASASAHLPENVLRIQQYIDDHYAEISSVSQIAAHFYYSREYVSRLFKQHFNTTVADYITKRRIATTQTLIAQGIPLSDICYRVGFGSMTAFIRSFRSVTNMTPSQYRMIIKDD